MYILANFNNNVLYIGLTNNLSKRVYQHKQKEVKNSFTARYNVNKLVYYETFVDINEAIKREKQLKNWHREWKINLVKEKNKNFEELFDVRTMSVKDTGTGGIS